MTLYIPNEYQSALCPKPLSQLCEGELLSQIAIGMAEAQLYFQLPEGEEPAQGEVLRLQRQLMPQAQRVARALGPVAFWDLVAGRQRPFDLGFDSAAWLLSEGHPDYFVGFSEAVRPELVRRVREALMGEEDI